MLRMANERFTQAAGVPSLEKCSYMLYWHRTRPMHHLSLSNKPYRHQWAVITTHF
jgi:hypothetical protein